MKFSFGGITAFSHSPLTWATAGLSLLWGCQHFPGSHSCHTSDDVACYQNTATTDQQLPTSSYEEPLSTKLNDLVPDAPPSVETPAPKPKEASPKLPPLPDVPDMTVPSKKPAAEKPPEPKPSEPDKPTPPKKKPAKPKTKKTKKPESTAEGDPQADEVDLFAPEEISEPDSDSLSEVGDSATTSNAAQRLTQTILEVPPSSESHDAAPSPREIPSATVNSRPVGDRQPMLLTTQSPELKLPQPSSSTTATHSPPTAAKKSETSTSNAILTLDAYCDHLVFDRQGFGYVTHRKQIVRFSPQGKTDTWTTLTNPKGHQVEPDGTHLVCDVDRRAVLRLSFDGKIIGIAAKDCDGTPLRSPYDLTLDGRGGFYFTDPGFLQMESPVGKVHYVDRSGHVSVIVSQLGYPTGIVYDSARNRLLVVESLTSRIIELQLGEPDRVESTRVFTELPKSKAVDYHVASLCQTQDGTLFVAQPQARTVQVFNATGRSTGQLTTGEITPNRVALRSVEAEEIFISGETHASPHRGQVIRLALGE